ncbi:geranylgeranyl diphosphate synthase, type I, partial [Candidatus Hakubella thermalkaliphila]
ILDQSKSGAAMINEGKGGNVFEEELSRRSARVYEYLSRDIYRKRFHPQHIQQAVYSYINLGGKSLRPSVLLFSCGAVGGEEEKALPAAAAVEVYHTWTLIHDDIIDRDERRRGGPTVHRAFSQRAQRELGYGKKEADHYGISIGILVGDQLQGWATSLLSELHTTSGIDPAVVLFLINAMDMDVQSTLIEGEVLDVQYSRLPVESINEDLILDMLWKKTGALYEFAGKAGAMIGLNNCSSDHPYVQALAQFASKCGIAFQLQDDILGIVGDEKKLGKPVGSDIREGKRTTILYFSLKQASESQRKSLLKTVGNESAREEEIARAIDLLRELGGIEHTRDLARAYVREAVDFLGALPPSSYKEMLFQFAEYMIQREF